MNRFAGYVMLFLTSAALSSCSFHKLVAGKKAKSYDWNKITDTGRVVGPLPYTEPLPVVPTVVGKDTSGTQQLISELLPIWKNRVVFTTFSGKAKVHFEGPDTKQEFTAHFRIRKDSVIWIAITGLGGMVPVARILITPDSFMMINQLQKEVTLLPLAQAAKILPVKVDFSSMQNLLVGEPLQDGKITDASSFGGGWHIQVEDSTYIQHITYNKSDSTMRSAQLRTRSITGPQAMTDYGAYMIIDNRRISTGRVINIQNGTDIYMVDMNFMKIDFDQPLDFPFAIPRNYTLKQQ